MANKISITIYVKDLQRVKLACTKCGIVRETELVVPAEVITSEGRVHDMRSIPASGSAEGIALLVELLIHRNISFLIEY